LFFLFRGEVVLNVEGLADLFGGLALDHVSNSLAGEVQQWLDVQEVSSQNELEQSSLVNLAEFAVPRDDVVGSLLILLLLGLGSGVLVVVFAVSNNLLEDLSRDVGQRDGSIVVRAQIFKHVLDSDGLASNLYGNDEFLLIRRL